jgi:hypothetical protein
VSLPAPAEDDRTIFERVRGHLAAVDADLSSLLDHHSLGGSLNVLGLIANAQREIRLANLYLVPKEMST